MKKIFLIVAMITAISCYGRHHHGSGRPSFRPPSPPVRFHHVPPRMHHISHHRHHIRPMPPPRIHYSTGYVSPGWISGTVVSPQPTYIQQPVTIVNGQSQPTYIQQPVGVVNCQPYQQETQIVYPQQGGQVIQSYHYEHHESHSSSTKVQSFRTINGY